MNTYRPSAARRTGAQTAPKEADMIPVMNLFLTIIPALMLMTVISQVALLAMNFAAGGGGSGSGGGGDDKAKRIQIHLMLREDPAAGMYPGMEIREPGLDIKKLPTVNGVYDYARLNSILIDLKARHTDTKEIEVIPHPEVLYDTLIRTIDLCKSNGFTTVHYKKPTTRLYIQS